MKIVSCLSRHSSGALPFLRWAALTPLLPGILFPFAARAQDDYSSAQARVEVIEPVVGNVFELRSVSRDGTVITGSTFDSDAFNERTPVIWQEATGLQSAPWLDGVAWNVGPVWTHGVNADGSLIVGRSLDPDGILVPVYWRREDGVYSIAQLPMPLHRGRAVAVDDAGTVIVGQVLASEEADGEALEQAALWKWNTDAQEWEQPLTLGFAGSEAWQRSSWLYGVSGDGTVAAGFLEEISEDSFYQESPMVWTEQAGFVRLPVPDGFAGGNAGPVSLSGSRILGSITLASGPTGEEVYEHRAALWTFDADIGQWDLRMKALPANHYSPNEIAFLGEREQWGSYTVLEEAPDEPNASRWVGALWDLETDEWIMVDAYLRQTYGIDFGDGETNLDAFNPETGVLTGTFYTGEGLRKVFRLTPLSSESPWPSAESAENSWRLSGWFGWFNEHSFPWILHLDHGWLYFGGGNETAGLHLFDRGLERWMWTSSAYFPYLWVYDAVPSWLRYAEGTGGSGQRWFFHYGTDQWILETELYPETDWAPAAMHSVTARVIVTGATYEEDLGESIFAITADAFASGRWVYRRISATVAELTYTDDGEGYAGVIHLTFTGPGHGTYRDEYTGDDSGFVEGTFEILELTP